MEQYPQEWREYKPIQPRGTDWRGLFKRLWAPIAAAGALLVKFGGVIFKAKFLFSMFASAGVYIWIGTAQSGWPDGLWFGIGLIYLLFIHEMGHVWEARRQGLPVSSPVFIPFLGALITLKQMPHNAWREARLAIAGPLLGSAGALALYLAGVAWDSRPLKALAFLGFLINLFNLLPVIPLDGGRITAALHPALWFLGFLALVGLVIVRPNPILILILIFAAMELWRRWQMRRFPEMQEYYRVRPEQRVIMGVLYFGLAVLLVLGMNATHVPRDF
jgi:Zn-dependent protease